MKSCYEHPLLTTSQHPHAPIIVIGMHRSGTTLAAKLLAAMGVFMGDKLERNYEAISFLNINDLLLRSTGASWHRPDAFIRRLDEPSFVRDLVELAAAALDARMKEYGKVPFGRQWGWKDPRTTLTLPIWLELFPEALVIYMERNGIDVAWSLWRRAWRHYLRPRRNDTERMLPFNAFVRGLHLWQAYVEKAYDTCRYLNENCLAIEYEMLLESPSHEVKRIAAFANLGISDEQVLKLADRKVRPPKPTSPTAQALVHVFAKLGLIDGSILEDLSKPRIRREMGR